MKSSPTKRTLDWLREVGYRVQVVEKYNPHSKTRLDLFGFIDIVAMNGREIVGVQATSGANHAARRKKILGIPLALEWLKSGGNIWVVSWRKRKPRGERERWDARIETVELREFEEAA